MNKVVNLLHQYISDNQLDKALLECKNLVKTYPNEIYLKKLLSHIYFLKDNYTSAINGALEILEVSPNDFDCVNNLGIYYLKQEEYELSLEYINKAKKINDSHPAPFQNSAELCIKRRLFSEAAKELDKCISFYEALYKNYKSYKSALITRIDIFVALKDQNSAIKFIEKYLSLEFDAELLLNLIQINKKYVNHELISLCIEKTNVKSFKSSLEKYQELVPIYFILSNYYEKDDPAMSEKFYLKGNKEVFNIQRMSMIKFQKQALKVINSYRDIKGEIANNLKKGNNNIFIVGMPRSGTTLTESLITANNEVFGAGELMSFYDLSYKYILDKEPDLLSMDHVVDKYIKRTNYFLDTFSKVADKLPNNYQFIGHIRKFMPASKIILILRDPWDLAVSLFKQRYVENISFSSSMFNIGVQMANFEMFILYWQKEGVIDDSVLTINYESLVKNFDDHQSKLYNFCEIKSEYEPAKREGFFAKTATMHQVQKKIYTDSVKKKDVFQSVKHEFVDAFYSQREFWKSKKITDIPDDYFGYDI